MCVVPQSEVIHGISSVSDKGSRGCGNTFSVRDVRKRDLATFGPFHSGNMAFPAARNSSKSPKGLFEFPKRDFRRAVSQYAKTFSPSTAYNVDVCVSVGWEKRGGIVCSGPSSLMFPFLFKDVLKMRLNFRVFRERAPPTPESSL